MLGLQKFFNTVYLNTLHKDAIEEYNKIKERCYSSRSINEKRQLDKLNALLNSAYKNVPYYTSVLQECGVVENGKIKLKRVSDIQAIPFLTKEIIRREKDNIFSVDHQARGSRENASGGSTGEPIVLLQDRMYRINNEANFYLSKSWRGADPYDSVVDIWGAPRDTYEGKKPLSVLIKDFFRNRIFLNCYKMSSSDMKRYVQILNKHKPKVIVTYAQSIFEIAKFVKTNNLNVEKQHAIHSAAGPMLDYMRKEIEEVFQCKVFNHYGSREVGAIASECSAHDGLHIMMEHTLVEVLDENGKPCQAGEDGEIVVTTLDNYSMPLIRYKIGDVGIKQEYKKCSCGCTYPKLQTVTGRTTDMFKTINNCVFHGTYFHGLFWYKDWIKAFQVIQKRPDLLIIKIVKEGNAPKEDLMDIEDKIKNLIGQECEVVFEFVESIPKTKTGKYLYTISEV